MSFENIKQLTKGEATIKIKDYTETVRLLTVSEREQYDNLTNEGLGTVQTQFGKNSTQKANMNIQKMTQASKRAEHYLIRRSFLKDDGTEIEEKDIDELYDLYDPLVSELKRVNGIIDTDDKKVIEALTGETENAIKKQ
ncbi:hypothetical protein PXD04_10400 [Methanosphaera sp. ISO3-F5]|uniref:hypothetical protein n=1 Tax=Methanosphaera sp. ISO3-F5 TaxID=1452353 RepID=UPI002B256B4F|nr:hypothetical protein [Methanosphaera sp. ISO3-F5]WQH64101.1 hypothetical protein PXD04_10400 [Methanosphaera sp. ISO3-F5]